MRIKYYDIHSHILPGLDDGPRTIEDALALVKAYVEDGAAGVIATPHIVLGSDIRNFIDRRKIAMELVSKAIESAEIKLELKTGAELMIGPVEDGDYAYLVLEIYAKELCLGETNLILVEYPKGPEPLWFEDSLFRLQRIGLQPVIAHAERYSWFRNRKRLVNVVERGAYLQVNGESLKGMLRPTGILARSLARMRLVHFVATDAHDTKERRPKIGADYGKFFWQMENARALCRHPADHIFYAS